LTYDVAEAQNLTDMLQTIINLYYPNGEPAGNGNPDVCCLLDTLNINLVNEAVIVTGGVEPYHISIDTTGNVKTVTVVDYDGCASTVQYTLSGLSEENLKGISIFPNPASTEIQIDLTRGANPIDRLQIISINGQTLKHCHNADRTIDISALSEGVYILQIDLADGTQINKRVLILR
jgi:hypothetical protein